MRNETRPVCNACEHRKDTMRRRNELRRQARIAHLEARRAGIESGKVRVITLRDEFTGFFYRINKQGLPVMLGSGTNYGA